MAEHQPSRPDFYFGPEPERVFPQAPNEYTTAEQSEPLAELIEEEAPPAEARSQAPEIPQTPDASGEALRSAYLTLAIQSDGICVESARNDPTGRFAHTADRITKHGQYSDECFSAAA